VYKIDLIIKLTVNIVQRRNYNCKSLKIREKQYNFIFNTYYNIMVNHNQFYQVYGIPAIIETGNVNKWFERD